MITEGINPNTGDHFWIVVTPCNEYRFNVFYDLREAAEFLMEERKNAKSN